MTPPASPRQPAWSIPTPSGATSAIGRQSATSAIAATPRSAVTWPSASRTVSGSAATTSVPWTWRTCARRPPARWATRVRFSCTRPASSSVHRPRLSDANGPSETPPRRVVNSAVPPGSVIARWSPRAVKLIASAPAGSRQRPRSSNDALSRHQQLDTGQRRALAVLEMRAPVADQRVAQGPAEAPAGGAVPDREAHRGHLAVVAVGRAAVRIVVGHAGEGLARRVDLTDDAALAVARREVPGGEAESAAGADECERVGGGEVLAAKAPDDRRARPDLAAAALDVDRDAVQIRVGPRRAVGGVEVVAVRPRPSRRVPRAPQVCLGAARAVELEGPVADANGARDREVGVAEDERGPGDPGALDERVDERDRRQPRHPRELPRPVAGRTRRAAIGEVGAGEADPERVGQRLELAHREARPARVALAAGRHRREPQRAVGLLARHDRRAERVADPHARGALRVGERRVPDLVVAGTAVPAHDVRAVHRSARA